MTKAHAGGQRGASTVDHLLTMKELIKMGTKDCINSILGGEKSKRGGKII